MAVHASHGDVVKRLKRANGHLAKVIHMIEHGAECLDVAQQLQAVISAVNNAKSIHVKDHIDHCLVDTIEEMPSKNQKKLRDLKEIAKYL